MPIYHGKRVLLGCRVVCLPSDEDLACLRPEAARYAVTDAVMPVKSDLIAIDGYEGEWLVTTSDQARTWNYRQCYVYRITGRKELTLSQYSSLRIAYDETGLDPNYQEGVVNVKQVLHDAIKIVGQSERVIIHVRQPALPEGVGLLSE